MIGASPTANSMSPLSEAITSAQIVFDRNEQVVLQSQTFNSEIEIDAGQNIQQLSGNPMLPQMQTSQLLPVGDQEQEIVQTMEIVSAHKILVDLCISSQFH